jgi:hypothetical protein
MISTISILETAQIKANREVSWSMGFYRLEAIFAVGYRVNSSQATTFRKSAGGREFIVQKNYQPLHPIF